MKRLRVFDAHYHPAAKASALALAVLALCQPAWAANAFTPGNFVAYRVATLGANPFQISLDEYRPDGTWVQTIALPTANASGVKALMAGTKGSEGLLNRSADRRCLAVPGYAVEASYPTAALDSEFSSAVQRAVAFVAADGGINSTTTFGTSAIDKGAIRSAATNDCTAAWVSGDEGTSNLSGVWYAARGSTTGTQIYKTKTQGITFTGGAAPKLHLYAGNNLRYFSALPTSLTTPSVLSVDTQPGNLRGIAFLDLDGDGTPDTLYGADNGNNKLVKYTWDAGQSKWIAKGTLDMSKIHGLAAVDTGDGNVMLLVTVEKATAVQRLFDRSGLGGTLAGNFEPLVSAPQVGGNQFYGLTLAPEASPAAARPAAPANLSAAPAGNSVNAAWGSVANAAYYVVEVSSDNFASVSQTLFTYTPQATVASLAAGTHKLRVRAVNSLGGSASAVSAAFTTANPPTTSLPAIAAAYSGVVGDATDPLVKAGLAFTVGDAADTVTATSSNPDVVVAPGGSGTDRTLYITPSDVGYADITVTIANASNASVTRTIKYAASQNTIAGTSTRWFTGRSAGSTAIARDGDATLLVGDDEGYPDVADASGNAAAMPPGNVMFAYDATQSGQPLAPLGWTDASLSVNDSNLQTAVACEAKGFTGIKQSNCKSNGEVDIEASFLGTDGKVYLAGSHSNSSSGHSRPDRWRFFAATPGGAGSTTTLTPDGYYQWLREDLRTWDVSNGHGLGVDYFGIRDSSAGGGTDKAPEADTLSGFSIEGMSTSPDDSAAWLGFRAPLVQAPGITTALAANSATNRTHALIIPIKGYASLPTTTGGTARTAAQLPDAVGTPIRLDLGGRGIREIRKNGNNEYLIVAGSANGAGNFALYSWDGSASATGLATNLHQRSTTPALTNFKSQTGCSNEGIADMPASLDAGGIVDIISDCGDADFYGDGKVAKELLYAGWKKFRADKITLAPLLTPQAIDFSPLVDQVLGTAPFTLAATGGGSGNPVVFSASPPAVCTVIGTTLTLVATGTCTVQANQVGGAGFAAAAPVSRAFQVTAPAASGTTWPGSGGLGASVGGGTWQFAANSAGFQAAAGLPDLPSAYTFPYGMFSFVLISGTAGTQATVSLTLPQAAPPGAVLWTYGRQAPGGARVWYQIPASFTNSRTVVSFAVTDGPGNTGDDDQVANSVIIDPVLLAVPVGDISGATPVPTLSDMGRWLLALALAGLAGLRLRQRARG